MKFKIPKIMVVILFLITALFGVMAHEEQAYAAADYDGDGLTDYEEGVFRTDPGNPDTDGDGVDDLNDAFPLDSTETKDSDATEKRITTDISIPFAPAISGNRIVWDDERHGNGDIYMYDLSTKTERPIITDLFDQYDPAISGNRIVWADFRNGNWDIYMYDLSTGTERPIITHSDSQVWPAISGDRIVWYDRQNGYMAGNIYLYAGDGVGDNADNCPDVYNPDQADSDGDGIGDACDTGPTTFTLTVNSIGISGASGKVESYPPGILCYTSGGDCSESYGSGANVTLTAYPEPGSYLEYWLGASCTAPFPCIVTMNNNRVVEAHFAPSSPSSCTDLDGDGYGVCPACGTVNTCAYDGHDCNDSDMNINPGMTELNNFIDDDCDGIIDNALCSVMDSDVDGWNDCIDNCPFTANAGQQDMDNDGYGDACDDSDSDLIFDASDACPYDRDNDIDGDGLCGNIDNCPGIANPSQADADNDGRGDTCESTSALASCTTNCTSVTDGDNDGIADSWEPAACLNRADCDADGILDGVDNCIQVANSGQEDNDRDGTGDACDADDDNDGVLDAVDNCQFVANTPQSNIDCDIPGDACDLDIDGDGIPNSDEVAAGASPTDADSDDDGISDGPTIPTCATYNPRIIATGDREPLGPPRDEIIIEVRDTGGNNITATWLPALLWNATTQRWDPANANIVARLKRADGSYVYFTGNVTFSLTDVSRHEGIAMNDKETCTGDCPFDYSFSSAIRDTHITTVSAANASVTLYAFDFGGKARITATTTYNGNTVTGTIKIPLDTDNDDLPDRWETDNGLSAFSLNQDDRWADRDISIDNTYNGDGLNNFAEYRGFVFDKKSVSGPAEILTGTHRRFDPRKKDLFVRGDGYKNSTACITAGARPASCTVPGLLDFAIGNIGSETNFKNAFENAGITVHDVTGCPSFSGTATDPFAEPPFVDIVVVKNDTVNTTTIVGSADGWINQLGTRAWTWDTKGAAYFGDAVNYHYFVSGTGTVSRGAFTYHLNLMNYFHNRPYWDSASTTGSYVANAAYNGLLDPQSSVEDTKLEDGSLQKTNKTATNEDTSPNDTKLKGDHVKLGKDPLDPSKTDATYPIWRDRSWGAQGYEKGYHFSTFDADGDGLVELPVVSDSKTISREYTALHVQRQTIMHEMGHAVGIRNPEHPCETPNVMCIPVRNWDLADRFSGTAMSQIVIHNR